MWNIEPNGKTVQSATNMFWHRQIKEYLPTLVDQKKWTTKCRNLEIGGLILIPVEHTARSHWPLGRIVMFILASTIKYIPLKCEYWMANLLDPVDVCVYLKSHVSDLNMVLYFWWRRRACCVVKYLCCRYFQTIF